MQNAIKHLTLEERCHIFLLKERGFSIRYISRYLSIYVVIMLTKQWTYINPMRKKV